MSEQWSILVVDDEMVQRESMAAWLEQDGYDVDVVASGDEAVRMAADKDYAIYFVDLKMPPGMDGIETFLHAVSTLRIHVNPVRVSLQLFRRFGDLDAGTLNELK